MKKILFISFSLMSLSICPLKKQSLATVASGGGFSKVEEGELRVHYDKWKSELTSLTSRDVGIQAVESKSASAQTDFLRDCKSHRKAQEQEIGNACVRSLGGTTLFAYLGFSAILERDSQAKWFKAVGTGLGMSYSFYNLYKAHKMRQELDKATGDLD